MAHYLRSQSELEPDSLEFAEWSSTVKTIANHDRNSETVVCLHYAIGGRVVKTSTFTK